MYKHIVPTKKDQPFCIQRIKTYNITAGYLNINPIKLLSCVLLYCYFYYYYYYENVVLKNPVSDIFQQANLNAMRISYTVFARRTIYDQKM